APGRKNGSWIEVDLLENKLIGGIVTWGRGDSAYVLQWVKTFNVGYRVDGSNDWTNYTNANRSLLTFIGNEERYQPVLNDFAVSIVARYIRLYPLSWNYGPTMRWEVLGCAKCKLSRLIASTF
ncbi:hypothetical protein CAPTEDRAFT_146424, partial [Capitella teleta]